MEKKVFGDYTLDEKEALLMHWWYYYGKLLVNLDEMNKFHEMVLANPEQIYKCAVVSYLLGYSSQGIISAMRKGNVEKYYESVNEIYERAEFKDIANLVEDAFIGEMVGTYNKPEPNVAMSEEEIVSQVITMMNNSEKDFEKVSADDVRELYRSCLLNDDEVKDDMPVVDFILGEGVMSVSVFNSDRIDASRDKIRSLFDRIIPDGCDNISFLNLCVDKNDNLWTGEHSTVDLLVQLGVATGDISYLVPRKEWKSLPGGMPVFVRNKVNVDSRVNSHKPHEYTKVIDEFRKNNS